jgi:hypothetical protein
VDDDDRSLLWTTAGASLLAGLLAFAACSAGGSTVCPAIGWSHTLTVGLADGWPDVAGGSLAVECASRCGLMPDGPDQLSVPLTGGSTVVQLDMTLPDSAVLTVLDADGTERAELDADLDWRRIGGSEDCGGPMAASVVVPAP